MRLGMEIFDGSVDTVIHRLPQIAQEEAGNAGHGTKGRRDDVHNPYGVGKRLLQGGDARYNDRRRDSWDLRQRRSIVAGQGPDESLQRADREAGAQRGFGDVAAKVGVEATAERRGVDGGEDGGRDRSGRGRHGRRCRDEVVGRR